jgi:ferredoxin-NADP reductase
VERGTVPGRLNWQTGKVISTHEETARTKSIVLTVPNWVGHRPGQHVDVRLTAADGYQAQRSYSIASAPEDGTRLTLTIEKLEGGEVSPYLVDELQVGDELELRGPIGGYFVWEVNMGGPLLLIAGGSGVVPLMAIMRHRRAVKSAVPTRFLYSSRSYDDIIYRSELDSLNHSTSRVEVIHTLTRVQPPGWTGYRRRIDINLLHEVSWSPEQRPLIFICGPTSLVEASATDMVELGHEPERIKTERFGPTGGG